MILRLQIVRTIFLKMVGINEIREIVELGFIKEIESKVFRIFFFNLIEIKI